MDEKQLELNHEVENREPVKAEINDIFNGILSVPHEPYFMVNHLSKYFNINTIRKALCRVGGLSEVDNMEYDPHIFSACEKRKAGIRGAKVEFLSDDESEIEWLKNTINYEHSIPFILENNWSKWWIGYGVDEIIWDKVGSDIVVKQLRALPFHMFNPMPDLKSVIIKDMYFHRRGNVQAGDHVAEYGKFLLTVKEGTVKKPYGKGVAFAIYFLSKFKEMGWDFWGQWLQKYASGFIMASVPEEQAPTVEQLESIKAQLSDAIRGAAMVYKEGQQVEVIYPSSSGDQFKIFRDSAIDDIHMAILGETLTSRVQNGSQAAATVHDGVQKEKIELDMSLVEQSVNRLIEYAYTLNFRDKSKMPKVKVFFEKGLQKERAERDQIVSTFSGKPFSVQYLVDHYGYKEEHFDDAVIEAFPALREVAASSDNQIELSSRAEFMDEKVEKELLSKEQATEDIIKILLKKGADPLDIEDIYSAIEISSNKEALDRNLSSLLEIDSDIFEEDLTKALFANFLEGLDGET